jgi:hypothetical protein
MLGFSPLYVFFERLIGDKWYYYCYYPSIGISPQELLNKTLNQKMAETCEGKTKFLFYNDPPRFWNNKEL